MSKNVAVFVDVANIFYAAKAAGVDIDYVTLLKSATAGRDFVRAYAYTGLDPENENQRQFHAFLARTGYKVVSKDIRKYGDGRIKANLDIELVVDMMRMGDKLDVAVVISGDGDFAPAIAAVQQMGVRVEVISFRGNTSSDLIDVADVFIDITTVAKVEKGARSGRRVASDGDLSMTEVPDKESGVVPRRRRRRDDDEADKPERAPRRRSPRSRDKAAVVEPAVDAGVEAAASSTLVAMPGEKLSRGAESAETPAEVPVEAPIAADAATESSDDQGGEDGQGRRRRRRRGGRGRGRSGRTEQGDELADVPTADAAPEAAPDVAEHADEVPMLPQHSGFGSVWDSQIGVPADRQASAASSADQFGEIEDFEGEPEVPEYLAAEKRQGQGRRRGGRGGSRSRSGGGYGSAIDRERYGSGSRSGSSYGSDYSRGGRGRSSRSSSAPRASAHAMEPIEQTPGGDPWSEVPPEVQALLKAELARRDSAVPKAEAPAEEAPKKTTRKRTSKKAAPAEADAALEAEAPAEEAPKKTTRKRTTKKPAADTEAEAPAEEAPKKTTRKRTTKKPAADTAAEAPAEEKPKKTTRKRTTKKPAADTAAEAPAEEA